MQKRQLTWAWQMEGKVLFFPSIFENEKKEFIYGLHGFFRKQYPQSPEWQKKAVEIDSNC
jgi:hypothetical protein